MGSDRKKRRPSLKRLYADLREAPPNVASLKLTEQGFEATFFAPVGHVAPPQPVPPPPKLVQGTPFPDDDSPINVADLTLNPIDLEERN